MGREERPYREWRCDERAKRREVSGIRDGNEKPDPKTRVRKRVEQPVRCDSTECESCRERRTVELCQPPERERGETDGGRKQEGMTESAVTEGVRVWDAQAECDDVQVWSCSDECQHNRHPRGTRDPWKDRCERSTKGRVSKRTGHLACHLKQPPNGLTEGEESRQYGLIAEEVAEVAPELVAYDEEGQPYSVRYHVLPSLLLNEMQTQQQTIETLLSRVQELERQADDLVP